MAPVEPHNAAAAAAMGKLLPYHIMLGITGGLLLLTVVMLAHNYHRLRQALHDRDLLSQLSARLREMMSERDAGLADLETYNEHLLLVAHSLQGEFVVGECDGDDDDDDDDDDEWEQNGQTEEMLGNSDVAAALEYAANGAKKDNGAPGE